MMKNSDLTYYGIAALILMFPLFILSNVVETNNVKLAMILINSLLVTCGFLCSLLGLRKSKKISSTLLGLVGLISHAFLYIYFIIIGLAALGSVNNTLGLLTFLLVVVLPTIIAYRVAYKDLKVSLRK